MNNRIRRFIAVTVVTMLAFCMLVSCDNNVITTKNKDVAYTEILETNGSFVYNGQNYDSLSDAIKAIAESGEPGTVEVTGTSYIRPVTIPEGADVTIDLKEHELKFFDVKDSAIKALAGANLTVSNGTLSLNSTDKSLSVLSAEGTDSETYLQADVKVNGPVSVSDGAKLYASNYLEDVRVYGPAGLVVKGEGVSYVTVNDTTGGETSYGTSPYGTIVDMTGTIDHVDKGFWTISRGTHTYFYGSLKEAVDSLEADDTEIKLIGDDNDSEKEFMDVVLDKSITIDFGYVASKYSIDLTNDVDLTTTGMGRFVGDITAAEGSESDLSVTNTYIIGDVTLSGDLTVSAGKIEGDVTVATVTGSDLSFFQGNVTASGDISLTDSRLISSELVESTLNSTGGNISLTKTTGAVSDITAAVGEITIANSEVPSTGEPLTAGNISAVTLDATGNADKHVIIGGNVPITGDIDLTYVEFNSGTETAPSVTSANGDINLTKVSGTAGAITANGEDGSGDVSIDNTSAEVTLTTGALTTENGDISVKGYSSAKPVTVNGNVSASNTLTSSNAVFNGTVSAASITDGSSTTAAGSVFKGNVTASGDINLTGSTFNSGTTTAPAVESTGGDVSLTNASGTAGAITAEGTDGDVTIDNSNSTITDPFKTGAVTAKDKADIKGKKENLTVDIRESVYADEISIKDSHISATALAKEKTGTVYTPAKSVTIDNPKNASGPSSSYIGNLYADKLSVSATSVGITLEVGNAVVSGGSSTESTVSGGFYDHFNHSGDGKLTINSGNFYDFTHKDGSETNTLKGGYFYVVGTSSDNGFTEINNLIDMVGSNGNITITSDPQTQKTGGEAALVALPTSASFNAVPNSGNVNLRFYSFKNTQTGVLKGGWVVDTNTTTAKTTAFTFGNGITVSGSVYLCLGDTITSNLSLIDEDSGMQVSKLKSDNTTSSSISIAMVPGTYTYKADVDVVFHSNTDTDTTVSKSFEYNTAVTLPTADSMNIKKEYYEVDYWTATAQSTTPVYNDGAEVTLTADTVLYAHWKESGVEVKFSSNDDFGSLSKTKDTYKIGYKFGAEEQGTAKGLATGTPDNNYFFIGWYLGNNLVTDDTIVDVSYRGKTLQPKVLWNYKANKSGILLTNGPIYNLNAVEVGSAISSGIYFAAYSGDYGVDGTKGVTIYESDTDYSSLTKEQMTKLQNAIIALSKLTGTTAYKVSDEYFVVNGESGEWTSTNQQNYKYFYLAAGFQPDIVTGSVKKTFEELINSI